MDVGKANATVSGQDGTAGVITLNAASARLITRTGRFVVGAGGNGTVTATEGVVQNRAGAIIGSDAGQGSIVIESGAVWSVSGDDTRIGDGGNGTAIFRGGDIIGDELTGFVWLGSGESKQGAAIGLNGGNGYVVLYKDANWSISGGDLKIGDAASHGTLNVMEGSLVSVTGNVVKHQRNGGIIGAGTVKGPMIISNDNGAVIQPQGDESEIATLTFDGQWDASGGVTLLIDITNESTDLLQVTGVAMLGGNLKVTSNDSFQRGDVFDVVTAAFFEGQFDNLPWDTYDATSELPDLSNSDGVEGVRRE